MDEWYARKLPKVGLAAEKGFYWRWNSQNKNHSWNHLFEVENL